MTLAHGLGGRTDLPLPLWLAMYGAAAALLVSFLVLGLFWRTPRLRGADAGVPLPEWLRRAVDGRAARRALRALGAVLLAGLLITAWAGPDDPARNPAPTWLYVWLWVGLVPASLLLGPVWRRIDPLRPLAQLLARLLRRRDASAGPPTRWGTLPALAGLGAFVWLELVYDHSGSPRAVAVFVTGYAAVQIAGGIRFGPQWFDRCEGFTCYAGLLAAAAPIGRRSDGMLVLRNPLDGLAALPRGADQARAAILLLGSTAFDGLSRTPVWSQLVQGTARGPYLLLGTAGLAGSVAAVALTYGTAVRLTGPYLRGGHAAHGEFGHTLVPIVVGYTVAHYFSFALFQGQAGVLLANDPLARGWDLLGLAGRRVDYLVMSSAAIAAVQVGVIVLGHVVAVVLAHDRSVALMPRRHARSGQYPMLAVMIAYTSAGIALLAGA